MSNDKGMSKLKAQELIQKIFSGILVLFGFWISFGIWILIFELYLTISVSPESITDKNLNHTLAGLSNPPIDTIINLAKNLSVELCVPAGLAK